MNETFAIYNWGEHCIVCQKSPDPGDEMVALCCPLCIETFHNDRKNCDVMRQLHNAQAAQQKGGAPRS